MRFLLATLTAAMLAAPSVRAQEPAPPPAHISSVEGAVTIDHDGISEPAVLNMPVLEGDRIRTTNGRVEVMLPDGSVIEIDLDSEVELLTSTRVRVLTGSVEH